MVVLALHSCVRVADTWLVILVSAVYINCTAVFFCSMLIIVGAHIGGVLM